MKLLPSSRRNIKDDDIVGGLLENPKEIPKYLDWRECGFKTPPENQRDCGSCYAYSIVGSIEGQIFKKTGRLMPLSEQQIVDCSRRSGNFGCSGGSLKNTLKYLEKSEGIMPETNYPYTAKVILKTSSLRYKLKIITFNHNSTFTL